MMTFFYLHKKKSHYPHILRNKRNEAIKVLLYLFLLLEALIASFSEYSLLIIMWIRYITWAICIIYIHVCPRLWTFFVGMFLRRPASHWLNAKISNGEVIAAKTCKVLIRQPQIFQRAPPRSAHHLFASSFCLQISVTWLLEVELLAEFIDYTGPYCWTFIVEAGAKYIRYV